jgi:hypothetical protein
MIVWGKMGFAIIGERNMGFAEIENGGKCFYPKQSRGTINA